MNRSIVAAIFIALGIFVWVSSGYIFKDSSSDSVASEEKEESLPSVQVIESDSRMFQRTSELFGTLVANRDINILSQTMGNIVEKHAQKGQLVFSGDKLVELDDRDRQEVLRQASSLLSLRQQEWEVTEKLSEKQFRSDTDVALALSELHSAQAALKRAQLDIEYSLLKAPFDAVIEDYFVEEGDFIEVGKPVARLLDLDPMKIRVAVSERDIGKIFLGQRAYIELSEDVRHAGEVSYISRESSTVTRTVFVEISIENPDLVLFQGMTARVFIMLDEVESHFISPSLLTLSDEGRIGVRTVNEHDEVEFWPIDIVSHTQEGIWITSLPSFVRFIVLGQEYVYSGQRVIPIMVSSNGLSGDI